MTQKSRILRELLVNPNVTSWELIERCHVTNPTGRIDELRKDGHKIENVRVDRNGRSLTAFILERP